MRRVLVAVDGSAPSEKALEYALEDAKRLDSHLTMLRVVISLPHGEKYPKEALKEEIKNAEEYLEELKDKAEGEKVKANTKVLIGSNAAAEIVRFAKEEDYNEIVVGSRGKTGLETISLGSVSESVVKRAPCPVLVVR